MKGERKMAYYSKLYLKVEVERARKLTETLVKTHATEYTKFDTKLELMAALLYGPVVAGTSDDWIGILEIVKNFPYPYNKPDTLAWKFQSTKQFPLRGCLSVVAVSPQEFEDALAQEMPALQEILEEPWAILYDPSGYLQRLMERSGVKSNGYLT
jgi:hypothetical protein